MVPCALLHGSHAGLLAEGDSSDHLTAVCYLLRQTQQDPGMWMLMSFSTDITREPHDDVPRICRALLIVRISLYVHSAGCSCAAHSVYNV